MGVYVEQGEGRERREAVVSAVCSESVQGQAARLRNRTSGVSCGRHKQGVSVLTR